tara:strand:+ start:214 stop:573 length:360 start_codon:yes stop_codon:yes gene_type:complete
MPYNENNIFAKILRKEVPCKKVHENKHVLAFEDVAPKAPIHILIIPKKAYVSFSDFALKASTEEMQSFLKSIQHIAKEKGLEPCGYRLITNHGEDAGQEVEHFHIHLLGGRPLGPLVQE